MKQMVNKQPDGTCYITNGNMWRHPYAAKAKCPDGVIRTVRLNQQADTYFSWPGRCTIKGKTLTGFVTGGDNGLEFHPYTNQGKDRRSAAGTVYAGTECSAANRRK